MTRILIALIVFTTISIISQQTALIIIGMLGLFAFIYLWINAQITRYRIGLVLNPGKKHNDFIYVWRDQEDRRYYKIGRTNNPFKRLKTFQTAQPKPIKVIAVMAVLDDAKAEQYLHDLFAESRVKHNNEWFVRSWKIWAYFMMIKDTSLTNKIQSQLQGQT